MNNGWEIRRLGDVCDLQNGFAFRSKDYISFSNTMNFRMSQIRPGGGIDLENNPKYLPDTYAIKYKEYLLREGDVVIAMTDMATETKILGVPTIVPKDPRNWLLNQRVGKLFDIDKTKIDVAFLKYILSSERINDHYKSLGRGGLQINIGKQDILNAQIPIPPLPEQKRIVATLDEAFAVIDKARVNTEMNLQNAKELFDSTQNEFFQALRDDKTPLESICTEMFAGGDAPKENFSVEKTEKYKIPIIANAVKDNGLYGYTNVSRVSMPSITIAARGSGTGHTEIRYEPFFPIVRLIVLIPDTHRITLEFLKFSIQNLDILSNGSAIPQLTIPMLKKYSIPVPSISQQKVIVQKLDELSVKSKKLETIYERKMNDLEELKKSILEKAFTGELTMKAILEV